MPVLKRDYYEILGVSPDANEDAIKRAFHAQARAWHPDVADSPEAEQRFRELAEAYSVLSRRETRLLYDRYGYRGRGHQVFDDAISEAFPSLNRADDVRLEIELRDFEAAAGTRRVVVYDALQPCKECLGSGMVGVPDPECEHCGGTGRVKAVSKRDSARVLHLEACPVCAADPCPTCEGTGTVTSEQRIRLVIPPEIEDEALLRVKGEGHDVGPGSIPGDLLVQVHVRPQPPDRRVVRYLALLLCVIAIAVLVWYVLH